MPRVMRFEMLDDAMVEVLRQKTPAERLAQLPQLGQKTP